MGKPDIVYRPRSDATPEAELNALANVYCFILDCHPKKEAAHPAAPNEAKGPKDARSDTQNYTG